jgi:hypothetical protein
MKSVVYLGIVTRRLDDEMPNLVTDHARMERKSDCEVSLRLELLKQIIHSHRLASAAMEADQSDRVKRGSGL